MLPHKIEAQNCICQCVIMSPLLIYYLFGDKLDRYKKHFENVSTNAKCEPGFLHIGSKDRLNKVLCVEDVAFATYFDYDTKYNHLYTSMTSISDCSRRSFKAYNWCKIEETITWTFNQKDADSPAQFVTLQRPKFEKYEQVSHVLRSGKVVMKKSHQYTFTYLDKSE